MGSGFLFDAPFNSIYLAFNTLPHKKPAVNLWKFFRHIADI